MTKFQDFIVRLFGGNAARPDPHETELRRTLAEGDEARRTGDLDRALALYRTGLEEARQHGSKMGQSAFLGQIGALHTARKEFAQAETVFDEARQLAEAWGGGFWLARALLNLSAFHLKQGNWSQAQAMSEQALDLARKASDSTTAGLALGNLADVYLKQGNPSYALKLLKDAAPGLLQHGKHTPYLYGRMGQAYLLLNDAEQGRRFLAQAGQLAQQQGQAEMELLWAIVLADQLYKEHRLEDALRLYRGAEQVAGRVASLPDEFDMARMLTHEADAMQRLGRADEAVQVAERALGLVRQVGDQTAEAKLRVTMGSAYQTLGRLEESQRELEAALAMPGTQHPQSASDRARALIQLGGIYADQGKADQAAEYFQRALEAAGTENASARAHALRRLGILMQERDELGKALEYWTEALNLFESSGEHSQAARLLCDIGGLRRTLTGINAAMGDYERATVMLSHVKDPHTRGVVLSNVANLYTDLGEVETARSFYQEALELAKQSGSRRTESLRLGNYGWYHLMIGQPQEGAVLIEQALQMSRTLGDKLYIAVQTNNLGQAYHDMKNYTRAETLFREALGMIPAGSRWEGVIKSNLGRTLTARGLFDEALALLNEAQALHQTARDRETLSRTLARIGEAHLRAGDADQADKYAAEGFAIASKLAYRKGQADALVVRAGAAQARGDSEAHKRHLREAWRLFNILHDPIADDLARLING